MYVIHKNKTQNCEIENKTVNVNFISEKQIKYTSHSNMNSVIKQTYDRH